MFFFSIGIDSLSYYLYVEETFPTIFNPVTNSIFNFITPVVDLKNKT